MTKADLIELVGKKVTVYFKDGESSIYGTLNYADEFSAKHNYHKPSYFYIVSSDHINYTALLLLLLHV